MSFLDFIFPLQSLEGKEGKWMTHAEMQKLQSSPLTLSRHHLEKRGIYHLDVLFAVSSYRNCPLLHTAIHRFKYKRLSAVGTELERLFVREILRSFPLHKKACICPVPLHWSRRFYRGFNQAEVLGIAFASASGLALQNLLKRVRSTGFQSHRKKEERWKALQGAFDVQDGVGDWAGEDHVFCDDSLCLNHNPNPSTSSTMRCTANALPENVYLIDDLFTTGATMEECAKVLKAHGVKRVVGLVLAYG